MHALNRTLFRLLLGSRLPVTGGTLEVAGARGPITLRRDRYGIPMIEAENELDAFLGLGFCQGQDRAVQIELSKRIHECAFAVLALESEPVDPRL